MGIHQLSMNEARPDGARAQPLHPTVQSALEQDIHFWIGRSGQRYIHTVYSLVTCPALPEANYVLVRTGKDGRRQPIYVGTTTSEAPSLNLAEIRQRGAQLGADEVHVHLLAEGIDQRSVTEHDLQLGCRTGLTPRLH